MGIDQPNIAIVGKELVITNEEAIVVKRNGRVMGTISAKYDFSRMPTMYHALCLLMIFKGMVLYDAIPREIVETGGKRCRKRESKSSRPRGLRKIWRALTER